MRLELAPRAVREAERHARWWREHRPDARFLFDDELRAALDLIRGSPEVGLVYQAQPGRLHRRVLMPKTRYHVYYRVIAPDHARIVAIWGAVRGRAPDLA